MLYREWCYNKFTSPFLHTPQTCAFRVTYENNNNIIYRMKIVNGPNDTQHITTTDNITVFQLY